MPTTRRFIIVADSIVDVINNQLHNLEGVDFRGGGNQTLSTFKLQRTSAPAARVDAWGCDRKLEDSQWAALKDALPPDGPTNGNQVWRRNSSETDTVISWYEKSSWTKAQVLLDVTRKPFILQLVPEIP